MRDDLIELRGEVPAEYVDVIDAVVQATPGASRISVLRLILRAWVEAKVHEATLVQRVISRNGNEPEPDRQFGVTRRDGGRK